MLKNKRVPAETIRNRTFPINQVLIQSPIVQKEFGLGRRAKTGNESRPPCTIALSGKHESVYGASKGFVGMLVDAYNQHHALVLRPDDVWQAIITQFSLYVQHHAEDLRSRIVNHEGQKDLVVQASGTLFNAPYEMLAEMIHREIMGHLNDPSVGEWIQPNFSTTTPQDRVVASITMMATVQAYFTYTMVLRCGLPSVELKGTVEDWQSLVVRAQRLRDFDVDVSQLKAQDDIEAYAGRRQHGFVLAADRPLQWWWQRAYVPQWLVDCVCRVWKSRRRPRVAGQ
eukprot:m.282285 g.282285  ORF g.282285 m.282285 type:complete len:284 (+) comp19845_c1_seq10:339-1190(+)